MKTGHFYFGKNMTFLNWLDISFRGLLSNHGQSDIKAFASLPCRNEPTAFKTILLKEDEIWISDYRLSWSC